MAGRSWAFPGGIDCRRWQPRDPRRGADLRGYGRTDAPDDIAAYSIIHLVGDLVGLVAALGETSAILVGHDWGATLTWAAAVMRPICFR